MQQIFQRAPHPIQYATIAGWSRDPGSFPVLKHLAFLGVGGGGGGGGGGGPRQQPWRSSQPFGGGGGGGEGVEYVNKSLGRQAILPKVSGSSPPTPSRASPGSLEGRLMTQAWRGGGGGGVINQTEARPKGPCYLAFKQASGRKRGARANSSGVGGEDGEWPLSAPQSQG